jgi:outer membrane protein OmpA-like peptidoglycan-associated protein
MKNLRFLGLAVAVIALMAPAAVRADNPLRAGWYVDGGGIASFQTDAESKVSGVKDTIQYDTGWGVIGGGGYAWGNGIRTEAEIAYRNSSVDKVKGLNSSESTTGYDKGGHIGNTSFMGNALYDFATGTRYTPYAGVGIGASMVDAYNIKTVNLRTLDSDRMEFAYQGIVGVAAALDSHWSATADYRYFRTTDASFKSNVGDRATTENASHNIVIGVRYAFGQPAAAPVPPPPAPQPVPPTPRAPQVQAPAVAPVPQSYMVFFDFDKSALTPEAKRIIASAAQDFKNGQYVRIVVTGHTDTMGTVRYNQKLSERRAASVKKEFAALGVPDSEIVTIGVGKNGLLVPTSDQVREAQNRRAEIVFNR